jgi:hypothetical protein
MPFQPGQSGNPAGSQSSRPWRAAIGRAIARAEAENNFRSLNNLADKLLEKAAEGDIGALKEMGDRVDGKVAQGIEHTGEGGGPIQAKVTVEFVGAATGGVSLPVAKDG